VLPARERGSVVYRVTEAPVSADELVDLVTVPEAGGVAAFLGVVRDNTAGRRVVALEYEAHVPMAEAKLKEIGEALHRRFSGVCRAAIVHRVGRLGIGEASVVIAVSAAHRGEAFEACRFAIDTLKQTVPIWKREIFEDGSSWVGLQGESPPAA
jgi:MoaE-MoaD fusion protein